MNNATNAIAGKACAKLKENSTVTTAVVTTATAMAVTAAPLWLAPAAGLATAAAVGSACKKFWDKIAG